VSEEQFQAIRAGVFATAMVLAVVLQRLAPHARLRGSRSVNGGLWLVNVLIVGAVCGACACTTARWAAREGIGVLNWAGAGTWAAIATSVVALDLVSYGWHRANHRVPLLWRFHQVHHSDPTFTASTGVRFHPGELLLSLPLRLGAVVLLGASVEAVVAFEVTFTVANLIEHGDIDVPRGVERALARVLVTPALHRRHHTKFGPARDTNFGTIFSVWDRLLGTFTPNDSATAVQTGLPGLDRLGLSGALVLPVRGGSARAGRTRLGGTIC
jgi:sterol desaturase/sphingolipid hydroxylase (fatty acid hydroxylase superfamily)